MKRSERRRGSSCGASAEYTCCACIVRTATLARLVGADAATLVWGLRVTAALCFATVRARAVVGGEVVCTGACAACRNADDGNVDDGFGGNVDGGCGRDNGCSDGDEGGGDGGGGDGSGRLSARTRCVKRGLSYTTALGASHADGRRGNGGGNEGGNEGGNGGGSALQGLVSTLQ